MTTNDILLILFIITGVFWFIFAEHPLNFWFYSDKNDEK